MDPELYPAIRFYSSRTPEALLLRGSRFYRGWDTGVF